MHVTPIQRLMGLMARLRTEGSIRGLGERSKNACPPPVFGRSRGVFMRLPVSMRLSRSLAKFIRWR